MRYLFPFVTLLIFFAGCKAKQSAQGPAEDVVTFSAAEQVMQQMIQNQVNTNWLDARASIKLDSRDFNVGGTAFIRLEKDKRLWVSVKKFGFEAARALVTPDSFFILNRLQNEYTAEPLSYIAEKYKMPARFDLLQQVVLGNPIFMDRQLDVETKEGSYHLYGQNNRWKSDYWLGQSTYYLERMRLKEVPEDRTLQVFYDDFKDAGLDRDFSHQRELEIESPSTGLARVSMTFNRLKFTGPIDMPFEVPARFKRSK